MLRLSVIIKVRHSEQCCFTRNQPPCEHHSQDRVNSAASHAISRPCEHQSQDRVNSAASHAISRPCEHHSQDRVNSAASLPGWGSRVVEKLDPGIERLRVRNPLRKAGFLPISLVSGPLMGLRMNWTRRTSLTNIHSLSMTVCLLHW